MHSGVCALRDSICCYFFSSLSCFCLWTDRRTGNISSFPNQRHLAIVTGTIFTQVSAMVIRGRSRQLYSNLILIKERSPVHNAQDRPNPLWPNVTRQWQSPWIQLRQLLFFILIATSFSLWPVLNSTAVCSDVWLYIAARSRLVFQITQEPLSDILSSWIILTLL